MTGYATPLHWQQRRGSDSDAQHVVHGIYKHCNLSPLQNSRLHWQERQKTLDSPEAQTSGTISEFQTSKKLRYRSFSDIGKTTTSSGLYTDVTPISEF